MTPGSLVIQVVACSTAPEMRRAYLAAHRRADVVELRLDALKDLDRLSGIDRLLEARGKPKLITVRSRRQGGAAPQAAREPLLRRALAAGVEYIDLEFDDRDRPLLGAVGRARRILSHHDLGGTPADLRALEARMRSIAGGALVKIVTLADAPGDNLRIRDLLKSAAPGTLIAFCAGPKGVPSRVLAPSWGSAAIYAPLRQAPATAPGQVALEDLLDLYRADRIGPRTRLLGVLGSPIAHSLSPLLHNTALRALDLDCVYLPFEATTVGEFLPVASELRVQGLSVTLPHKEKILPYLDGLDEVARGVGAVNTVLKVWNRLEGFNTDVEAALAPLRRRMRLRDARVAVMGAGGAARALVYGLLRERSRVTLFNRTASRGRALARALGTRHLPWHRLRRFRCDLLVNATSAGMAPDLDRVPIPPSWVAAPLVYDIIYNPHQTLFLRQAREGGAEVIDGSGMFVAQAEAQFRLFTRKEAPAGLMRRTLLRALAAAGA